MSDTYFPNVSPIAFEGADTDNPLAFAFYEADRVVAGRSMAEHFKFAVSYWHSFGQGGADPFGGPTQLRSWHEGGDAQSRARRKMDAAFEFFTKLGVPYYCFHDYDLVDEGATLAESNARLAEATAWAKEHQENSGVKLLWGTANLFSNPRYMNGAATNPDFTVVARAGAQVKAAIDATIELGGENYVFWGGREGYISLLNTDMKREQEHMARFLGMARDYARAQGFKGCFFIEPKPMEPTKHQYDYDSATVVGFLERYGLANDFKLNLEVNHATLAGHSFEHELQVAADAGMLGSIDANRGDEQNGWDTDQFPINSFELTQAMMVILKAGGLAGGGVNFDAKLRRNSTSMDDLFIAHIAGMDAFAKALVAADRVLSSSDYQQILQQRYSSFDQNEGKAFETGQLQLECLDELAQESPDLGRQSGKQERLEQIVWRELMRP